jgi:hypothetical protein
VDGADLVVLSEVGYFLSPGRLRELGRRASELAAASGSERATVLACHWRHEIVGWPLRGEKVHEILDEVLGLPRRAHLVEDDVVLSVWSSAEVSRAARRARGSQAPGQRSRHTTEPANSSTARKSSGNA